MLESQRGFLLLAFAAVSALLFINWKDDQNAKQQAAMRPATELSTPVTTPVADSGPDVVASSGTDVPTAPSISPTEPAPAATEADRYVELRTDVLRVVIDRVGGDVVEADLLKYRKELSADSDPIHLLQYRDNRTYVAQSGLSGTGGPDSDTGRATYSIEPGATVLADGNEALTVKLDWTSPEGLSVSKRFTLARAEHLIKLDVDVKNGTAAPFAGRLFTQLKRDRFVEAKANSMGLSAYTGAAFNTADKRYEKYKFEAMDEAPLNIDTTGGWVSYLQHYFIAAWVPADKTANNIYTRVRADKQSIIGIQQAPVSIAPGESMTLSASLYLGPKIQDDLAKVAPGLDLTVDYGFLWWIGQPLFIALTAIHAIVGNWGVAIILVTMLVKLLLYPVASAQYRSFAKMRMMAPKLAALKERYGDDRQAFSQAMMELYKKEKVNPLGGCLPLLITMPIFMALYWVLMESVELRHAGFILWIKDLSVMDPYYVLPILMGISMWVMQKMQPASPTMDPMQQKIMQYMPVIMSVFFLWFPAGLVLYWLVNNLLSIAQQTYITKKIEHEQARKS
ncbi:membrane protein insertase YidC [Permianibacter sp. IMCC34836]|uniref:membrane protein insertase YidC n=1 Tax=Permianibacter fluminis TaxID=2738515 RepID=UPI001555256A|nr:membrane protein insertase YidC [Permianibacter fluminis]NQD36026.1 membrane protein insertase YidC [Permianibacter fluminis]